MDDDLSLANLCASFDEMYGELCGVEERLQALEQLVENINLILRGMEIGKRLV